MQKIYQNTLGNANQGKNVQLIDGVL